MMAASVADGVTVLSNVAQEPEVVDLAQFLIACGAIIEGVGTSKLVIHGRRLRSAEFTIIPDRIEAGTFMVAAAITSSCISLSPVLPRHLTSTIDILSAVGCRITQRESKVLEVLDGRSSLSFSSHGLHSIKYQVRQELEYVQEPVDPFALVADELSILANRLRSMVVAEVPKLASAAEYFFKVGAEGKKFRPTLRFARR